MLFFLDSYYGTMKNTLKLNHFLAKVWASSRFLAKVRLAKVRSQSTNQSS